MHTHIAAQVKEQKILKDSIHESQLWDIVETLRGILPNMYFKNEFTALKDFISKMVEEDHIKNFLLDECKERQDFIYKAVTTSIASKELEDNIKKTLLDHFEQQQDLVELLKEAIALGIIEEENPHATLLKEMEKQENLVNDPLQNLIKRKDFYERIENRADFIQKNLEGLEHLIIKKAPKEQIDDHVQKINDAFQENIRDLRVVSEWRNINHYWVDANPEDDPSSQFLLSNYDVTILMGSTESHDLILEDTIPIINLILEDAIPIVDLILDDVIPIIDHPIHYGEWGL